MFSGSSERFFGDGKLKTTLSFSFKDAPAFSTLPFTVAPPSSIIVFTWLLETPGRFFCKNLSSLSPLSSFAATNSNVSIVFQSGSVVGRRIRYYVLPIYRVVWVCRGISRILLFLFFLTFFKVFRHKENRVNRKQYRGNRQKTVRHIESREVRPEVENDKIPDVAENDAVVKIAEPASKNKDKQRPENFVFLFVKNQIKHQNRKPADSPLPLLWAKLAASTTCIRT